MPCPYPRCNRLVAAAKNLPCIHDESGFLECGNDGFPLARERRNRARVSSLRMTSASLPSMCADDYSATVAYHRSSLVSMPYFRVILALSASVAIISSASILIKLANAPVLIIAAYRLGIAALVLAPLALTLRRSHLIALSGRDWLHAAIAGSFLGLHFIAWIASLEYTSVASSVVLVTINPIFVGLGMVIIFRERLHPLLGMGYRTLRYRRHPDRLQRLSGARSSPLGRRVGAAGRGNALRLPAAGAAPAAAARPAAVYHGGIRHGGAVSADRGCSDPAVLHRLCACDVSGHDSVWRLDRNCSATPLTIGPCATSPPP